MGFRLGELRVLDLIFLVLASLVVTLLLFETTQLDTALQNCFYSPTGTQHWVVDPDDQVLRNLFYTGPKALLILFGTGLLVIVLLSFRTSAEKLAAWRVPAAFILFMALLIPGTVSLLKKTTNVFCPYELKQYGGAQDYVHLFQARTSKSRGRGFPAGHASGGFGLMSLALLARERRKRLELLSVSLILGWVMGIYQMLKGAHFLSHTIVSMELAALFTLFFYGLFFRAFNRQLNQAILPPL